MDCGRYTINSVKDHKPSSTVDSDRNPNEWILSSELSKTEKEEVIDTLEKWQKVFSRDLFEPGKVTRVEHCIETGNANPSAKGRIEFSWLNIM